MLQVSSHVHDVFGGSSFSPNYDPNVAVNSQCTTIVIPQDKSNYWVVCAQYIGRVRSILILDLTSLPCTMSIRTDRSL